MDNFAVHMRICGVGITDDEVNSRNSAATSLATAWNKESTVAKIAAKAADIAGALSGDGIPSSTLGDEVQKAIQKKSSSYLYEERPLDVGVCAGMAMVSILKTPSSIHGYTSPDVYAALLWSTLAYQPALDEARREKLRREVLDSAFKRSTESAEKARERIDVPDPSAVKVVITPEGAITNNVPEAMAKTVDALRRNAALDREELDFLWWAQLGHSRLLNRPLSAISEPTRLISAGIEAAKMLRRLPCEVHQEVVLRTLKDDPELDLVEVLNAVGEDRKTLAEAFSGGYVAGYPSTFPLLHALATGEADGPGASMKRRVSEWGGRALLEAGLIKMMSTGLSKL